MSDSTSTAPAPPMVAFSQSYPINFALYNKDAQNVLYIDNDPAGQDIQLEIDNTSKKGIAFDESGGTPGPDNHHFELRFRPETLSPDSLRHVTLLADGWLMSAPVVHADANNTVSLYLQATKAMTLQPGATIRLLLHRINASVAGGTRGTRVELRYQHMTYEDESTPIVGYREQHIDIINHRGQQNIPLHVGFVGSNTVLNDGHSENTLRLRVTNVLLPDANPAGTPPGAPDPLKAITFNPPAGANDPPASAFVLSFDTEPNSGDPRPWALGTVDQVQAIKVFEEGALLGGVAKAVKKGSSLALQSPLEQPLKAGDSIYISSPAAWATVAKDAKNGAETIAVKSSIDVDPGARIYLLALTTLGTVKEAVHQGTTLTLQSPIEQPLAAGDTIHISPTTSTTVAESVKAKDKIIVTSPITVSQGAQVYKNAEWNINRQQQGDSPQWTLTPEKNSVTLKPGEWVEFTLADIISSLPTGNANLYFHYENIPGYWDGQFICTIEKSPLVCHGQNVGIGTMEPGNKLAVTGSVAVDGQDNTPLMLKSDNGDAIHFSGVNSGSPFSFVDKEGDRGFKFSTDDDDLLTIESQKSQGIRYSTYYMDQMTITSQSDGNGNIIGGSVNINTGVAIIGGGYRVPPEDGLMVEGSVWIGGEFGDFAALIVRAHNTQHAELGAGVSLTDQNDPLDHANSCDILLSIYCLQSVAAISYYAFSDSRTKHVIGASDKGQDLEVLNQLEVTDYSFIDVAEKGNLPQKKLIAQQVQDVYPAAISTTRGFIPSVYEMGISTDYDAALQSLTISIKKEHDFAVGDTVRIIDGQNTQEVEVLAVIDDHTFAVNYDTNPERVFVYGKEVDDFLVLDYEAIAMLNVSATQELASRAETQAARIERLETEKAELKAENAEIKQRLAAVEAALERIEALVSTERPDR